MRGRHAGATHCYVRFVCACTSARDIDNCVEPNGRANIDAGRGDINVGASLIERWGIESLVDCCYSNRQVIASWVGGACRRTTVAGRGYDQYFVLGGIFERNL